MSAEEFNELAGRIEGLANAVMFLAADLEERGIIDGHRYSESLREMADVLCFEGAHLEAARRTLREMAKDMDGARNRRRSKAARP